MSGTNLTLKVFKNNVSLGLKVESDGVLALLVQIPGLGPQGPAGPAGTGIGPTTFTLPAQDGSIEVSAGEMIWGVGVLNDDDMAAFSIGTTDGGQQLVPETPVAAGSRYVFFPIYEIYVANGDLYFNGVTSNCVIKVYKS